MKNFKDFIDEKIVIISETKEEMESILRMCEKNGIKWKGTNAKPLNYPSRYGLLRLGIERGLLAEGWLYGHGRDIVKASEILTSAPTPIIEIFQSKQTVVRLKKQDGKVVAVGKAKCNPDDEFDFEFGATLAYQRMIGLKPVEPMKPPFDISDYEQGIKTLKNGIRVKKQDVYEVGDRVLIKKKVDIDILGEMKDCVGKVCTIKEVDSDGDYVFNESDVYCFGQRHIKGKVIS